MIRLLVALLFIALIALQIQLWQQHGQVRDLRRSIEAQQEQNLALNKRNHELAAEVDDLRAGQQAIEERARTQLGLIAEGEQFIQIIEQPPTHSAPIGDNERPDTGDEQS